MPFTGELLGQITYSPSTQNALPGQLKVMFEGLHWDVKCRAGWAWTHRLPLAEEKIRDEVRELFSVKEEALGKVTLRSCIFQGPVEIFSRLIYARMLGDMEKHCTGV